MPSLAPSSPPHSPSARGSACARLSHMLLRAAQVAMMALLGAREHLEHPPARIELLYNIIRRSMDHLGRGWASLRAVRFGRVSASLPGHTAGTVFAHVEPQTLMYMIVLSVVVVQW